MKGLTRVVVPLKTNEFNSFIQAPASKSYGQRALACALVNPNLTEIEGLGHSDDEMAVLEIVRALGCEVHINGDTVRIWSRGVINLTEAQIDCNESGLATRMLIPVFGNSERELTIAGSGSLLGRSIALYDDLFDKLGAMFSSNNGRLPATIKGPIKPVSMTIDASKSSQYLTGLIIAYVASPYLTNATITCVNPVSVPYLHLTLDVLSKFGVDVEFTDNKLIFNGPYRFEPAKLKVEGDWSSVSFFIAAAAIGGSIRISGLEENSHQADRQFLEAVTKFGAQVKWDDGILSVKSHERRSFEFDATDCPDLFPPLAILASFGKGRTRIKGVSRLYDKESNRALTIQSEWGKFGVNVELVDDEMIIEGVAEIQAKDPILAHGDHRIAMGAAILTLFAKGPTVIMQADAVNKSFPQFYKYLEKLY